MSRILTSAFPDVARISINSWSPPVDIQETDEDYMVEADLPGVRPDDVTIDLEGKELRIRGHYGPVSAAVDALNPSSHRPLRSACCTASGAWIGLTLYALLAGADFGAGVWDLLAGGSHRGRPQRELIAHSIGPVWEANHVWLIFVIVLLWTAFPAVFAAVMSTLYIPLTLTALGIVARGAAFPF